METYSRIGLPRTYGNLQSYCPYQMNQVRVELQRSKATKAGKEKVENIVTTEQKKQAKYTPNEWRRCENYTRNEWRRCENYTRNECKM